MGESPVYTFGTIAFIPALHAAIKLRRRNLWSWAVGLIAADVVGWSLLGTGSDAAGASSTPLENVGTIIIIAAAVAGTVLAFRLRGEVFSPSTVALSPTAAGPVVDPAIASSLAARKRREESVKLTVEDPRLARDLKIGRPDLARAYDDGGLVDVNHVPEAVLVSHLDLTPVQARAVVAARDHIDGFREVDDLGNLAELPPRVLDAVRDRVVTL